MSQGIPSSKFSLIALAFVLMMVSVTLPCRQMQPLALGTMTSITFSPASVSLDVGQDAWISILINEVNNLYGADVRLAFNPSIIEILDAIPGDPVSLQLGDMPYPDFVMKNQADNASGTIWYAVVQLSPREPVSGSGFLAHIHIRGKNEGVSVLSFTSHDLATRDGLSISHSVGSCTIQVGTSTTTPTSTLTPTATSTRSPTATAGASSTASTTPTITHTPATSSSPTVTRTPTTSLTPALSYTPSPIPVSTQTPTLTSTPQSDVTDVPTVTPTPTFATTATPSPQSTLTATPGETPTRPSPTPTLSGAPVYIRLRASRDTYITGEFPEQNFGSMGALELSLLSSGPFKNALVGFDLESIPRGAIVMEAKLMLFGRDIYGRGNIPLWVYGLRRDWDELRATWRRASTDAFWEQPGAMGASDHDSVAWRGSFVDGGQIDYYEWDVRSLVQEWVSGVRRNDGFLVTSAGGEAAFIKLNFYSREYREFALLPFLSLVYVLPPPTPTPTATETSTLTATPTVTESPTETATPTLGAFVFLPLILKFGQ